MKQALLAQFRERVERQPDAPALDIDGRVLGYQELWQLSCQLAEELKTALAADNGKGKDMGHRPKLAVAALHFRKSNEFVIAQLACWLSGFAFLPLDVDWPAERKQLAMHAAGCRLLLFSESTELPIATENKKNIQLGDYITPNFTLNFTSNITISCTELGLGNSRALNSTASPLLHQLCDAEPAAYIIFTSGSSGKPKGVVLSFSGLLNTFNQQISVTQLAPLERMLWLHHVCFDASIADVWVTLLAGAVLVANTSLNPLAITDFIREQRIAYVDLPTAFVSLLSAKNLPRHLKTVLLGGEAVSLNALTTLHKKLKIVIAYGPSEASICSSMHVFTGDEPQSGYIGRPIPGIDYRVIDSQGQAVNRGEVGELVIVGQGVALGYLNASAADQARFFKLGKLRAFKTGDLIQTTEANYCFKGRVDRQFKLHGKLICPEEIEQVVLKHPQVAAAYAFLNKNLSPAEYWLCVAAKISTAELTAWMKVSLPHWMCAPKCWIFASLPRNANGKVDQAQLINACENQLSRVKKRHFRASFLSHIQEYSGKNIVPQMQLGELAIDSIGWLMILLSLREKGFTVDAKAFYHLLMQEKTTIANLENLLKIQAQDAFIGKDSAALCKFLSRYPELALKENHRDSVEEAAFLVSGATGHLGGSLLSALLKKNKKIYCLVRKNSPSLASLKRQFHQAIQEGKLQLVFSDITQKYFGCDSETWQFLSAKVTDVYHCAADTNVLKPLEELIAANVTGTYHVLQFCAEQGLKRLHYASTLALVVDSDWRTKRVDESNKLSSGCYYGGYTQSKWLAEQLVQRYSHANIFRFGLLLGETNSQSASTDLFKLRLQHLSQVHSASNASFDFTPSYQAAEIMCLISQHAASGIFHIHNPKPVSAEFVNKIFGNMAFELGEEQGEASKDPYRLYKMTDTKIQSGFTSTFLSRLGATMPSASKIYIEHYLKSLVK